MSVTPVNAVNRFRWTRENVFLGWTADRHVLWSFFFGRYFVRGERLIGLGRRQAGKATGFGSVIRRFESSRPSHFIF